MGHSSADGVPAHDALMYVYICAHNDTIFYRHSSEYSIYLYNEINGTVLPISVNRIDGIKRHCQHVHNICIYTTVCEVESYCL